MSTVSNPSVISASSNAWPDQAPSGLELDRAVQWCCELASDHADRLPGVARLLAGPQGPDAAIVFAFLQRVHDFARSPEYASRRMPSIDAWEALLVAAYHGEASHPIFVALRDLVRRLDLPVTEFIELIDAQRADLVHSRYQTWSELERYGQAVSRPLGRLTMRLLRHRAPRLLQCADAMSFGLWMVDMLWDVGEDLGRNRVYIPAEDLLLFGVDEHELTDRGSPRVASLVEFECARARMLLLRGRPLLLEVPAPVAAALTAMWLSAFNRLEALQARAGTADPSLVARSGSANQ